MTEPPVVYADDCELPAFRHGPGLINVKSWAAAPRHRQVYAVDSSGGFFCVDPSRLAKALQPGPSDDDFLELDSRVPAEIRLLEGGHVVALAVNPRQTRLAVAADGGSLSIFNLPLVAGAKPSPVDLKIGSELASMAWVDEDTLLVAAYQTVLCCRIVGGKVSVVGKVTDLLSATAACPIGPTTVAIADTLGEPERVRLWDTRTDSVSSAVIEGLSEVFSGDEMLSDSPPWVVHCVCSLRGRQFAAVIGPAAGAQGIGYSAVAIVEAQDDARRLVTKTVVMDPYFVESECVPDRPAGWTYFLPSRGLLFCGHACSGQVAVLEEPHDGEDEWACWVGPEGRQLGCAVQAETNLCLGGPPIVVEMDRPVSLPVTEGAVDHVEVYRMVLLPHSDGETSSVHYMEDRPGVGIPKLDAEDHGEASLHLEFGKVDAEAGSEPTRDGATGVKAETTANHDSAAAASPEKETRSPFGVFGDGGKTTTGFGAFSSPSPFGAGFGSSSSGGFGAFGTPASPSPFGTGSAVEGASTFGGALTPNAVQSGSSTGFGAFSTPVKTTGPFSAKGSADKAGTGSIFKDIAKAPDVNISDSSSGKEEEHDRKKGKSPQRTLSGSVSPRRKSSGGGLKLGLSPRKAEKAASSQEKVDRSDDEDTQDDFAADLAEALGDFSLGKADVGDARGEEKIVEIATKTGVVEEAKDDAITTEEAGQHEDASTPKLSSPTHKTEEDTHEDTDEKPEDGEAASTTVVSSPVKSGLDREEKTPQSGGSIFDAIPKATPLVLSDSSSSESSDDDDEPSDSEGEGMRKESKAREAIRAKLAARKAAGGLKKESRGEAGVKKGKLWAKLAIGEEEEEEGVVDGGEYEGNAWEGEVGDGEEVDEEEEEEGGEEVEEEDEGQEEEGEEEEEEEEGEDEEEAEEGEEEGEAEEGEEEEEEVVEQKEEQEEKKEGGKSGCGLFGSAASSSSSSSGFAGFGGGAAAAQSSSSSSASPFGAPPGAFGSKPPASSPFGAQSSSGGFGAFGSSQSSSSSSTPFGGASTASSGGGFGAFGGKSSTPSPFGSAATTGGGFGAFGSGEASSSSGFGAFGSTSSSSAAQTSFGAFGGGAQKGGPFGSTPSTGGGFGAFGSTSQSSSSSGFGGFGGAQSASGFGAFGGTSSLASGSGGFGGGQISSGFGSLGSSQLQRNEKKTEVVPFAKKADGEAVVKTEKDDGLEARAKPTPPQENDSKENTKELRSAMVPSGVPAASAGRRGSRASVAAEMAPSGPKQTPTEDLHKKTTELLDEIAKDADDGEDSREARALFSEVEKDLEQLEAFMKAARKAPCHAAPEADLSNEVWVQLRKSVESLTEIANEDTLKQLDEIQKKNCKLNAQLSAEMVSGEEGSSEVVMELRERCKGISSRIDEAYGECKKALFMRRGRRSSGGANTPPPSPELPPAPRLSMRPRPSVVVDGPTMPTALLAPPAARRRHQQGQRDGGSALGKLAHSSPQQAGNRLPRPLPPVRVQPPEWNVDSLRASVRRLRNPLTRRAPTQASTTSGSSSTVEALLTGKSTGRKVPAPALALRKEGENEGNSGNIWSLMRTKAHVSVEIQSLWEKVSDMERRLREVKLEKGVKCHSQRQGPALPAPMAALADEQLPKESPENDKVASVRNELRQQLDSSQAGSIGRAPSSGSWSESSDYAAASSIAGNYSTPSVTNVPPPGGLMFVNPLGGSGTPTFGGGRASPAASISRSPSRTPKDVVKSMNAAREAMIPKAVVPPAPKLETIPSVPPPPKLNPSPTRVAPKHRTLSSSMSFGLSKDGGGQEQQRTMTTTTPDSVPSKTEDKPFGGSLTVTPGQPKKTPEKKQFEEKTPTAAPKAAYPEATTAKSPAKPSPPSIAASSTSTSGGLFGAATSSSGSSSLFGSIQKGESSSSSGVFGSRSSTSKPAATGGAFGSAPSSSGLFGGSSSSSGVQPSSSSSASPFGSSTSSSTSAAAAKPGGLFGSAAPSSSSSSGFGGLGGGAAAAAAAQSSSSSSASPFGAPPGAFGSKPPASSPFGAQSSSGGFGAFGSSQSSSSSSPFGGASTSSSGGGFGAFGGKSSTPSPFGSAATTGGGFGAFGSGEASSSSGFGAFGSTSSSSAAQTSFGAFGGGAQKGGPFGSTPSTGGGFGAFGSTSQSSSSSGFGGFGGAQSASGFGAFGGTSSPASGSGGFGAFGSGSNAQSGGGGFGAFGGGQTSSGFGAFGGAAGGGGGSSQPQNAFSGWR